MTRRYEQRLRAESAAETRRRILDAAHSLLRRAPAKPISVDEVAKNAAVARSTVYTTFESRAGLFDALAAEIWDRAGYPRLLEAVRVDDARESLRRPNGSSPPTGCPAIWAGRAWPSSSPTKTCCFTTSATFRVR